MSSKVRGVGASNLLPGIGRFVVVGVQTGKEKQDRNALTDERRVVARAVTGLRRIDPEAVILTRGFEQRPERRASPDAPYVYPGLPYSPDHVHVDHSDRFVERECRVVYPVRRAE